MNDLSGSGEESGGPPAPDHAGPAFGRIPDYVTPANRARILALAEPNEPVTSSPNPAWSFAHS